MSDHLVAAGDTRYYQLTLTDYHYVSTRLHGDDGGALQTRLRWLGPDGSLLVQSDGQGPSNPDPEIGQYLTPGTYYVAVLDVAGAGDFTLTAASHPGGINLGQQQRGDGFSTDKIALGDFNGDGIPDVVLANNRYDKSTVVVQLGFADGGGATSYTWTFTVKNSQGNAVNPQLTALAMGDFNRDGKLDVVVCSAAAGEVIVLLGRGDGTFEDARQYLVGTSIRDVVVGDFNGDGIPDLATADDQKDDVAVLLGRGDGTFNAPVHYKVGSHTPEAIVAADLNNDGHLDLATVNANHDKNGNSTSVDVTVLLGNGDGTFQPAGQPYTVGPAAGYGFVPPLAVGDVNGDAHIDLVTGTSEGEVSLLLGRGDGTFQPEKRISVESGVAITSVQLIDFDKDGRLDLLTSDTLQHVTIQRGRGDGTFATDGQRIWFPGMPVAFVVGDLNGDGVNDIYAACGYFGNAYFKLNRGDGTFPDERPSQTLGFTNFALPSFESVPLDVTGAFTNDGHLDFAAVVMDSSGYPTSQVAVMLGQGDGTFGQEHDFSIGSSPLVGITAADLNRDDRLDLAVAQVPDYHFDPVPLLDLEAHQEENRYNLTILLGRGDGTFLPSQTIDLGPFLPDTPIVPPKGHAPESLDAYVYDWGSGVQMVTGDFTGDGIPDLIALESGTVFLTDVSNNDPNALPTEISFEKWFLMAGRPDGTLGSPQRLDLWRLPPEVANTDNALVISLGLVAGDFNGDGRLDLAVHREIEDGSSFDPSTDAFLNAWSRIYVFLGQEGGGFKETSFANTPDPGVVHVNSRLVAATLNGDGRTDLVEVWNDFNGPTTSITPYVAEEDGSFRPAQAVLRVDGLTTLPLARDINHDGRLDLVVPFQGLSAPLPPSPVASVFLGQGDGTFRSDPVQVISPHTSSPYNILVGDVTGNGRDDVVLFYFNPLYANSVAVLRNLGGGQFADQADLITPLRATPRVADLDDDGTPDVLVTSQTGNALWRRGRPDERGTFDPPLLVNPGRSAHDAVMVAGAGPPLAATIDASSDTVSLYAYHPGGFTFIGTLSTGSLPAEIESADLDGDGRGDLVVRNAGSGTLTVYRNTGGGSFIRLADVPVGTDASSVTLADVNGDHRLDLLVTDRFSSDVQVWHNRGDGTFVLAGRYRAGQGFYGIDNSKGSPVVGGFQRTGSLAVGDVTGDGIPDLLTGNADAHTFGVLAGLGGGRFAKPQPILVADQTNVVCTADLTGAGRDDIVTLGPDGVRVSLSLGGGRFAPPVVYDVGANATGMSVADINGDGLPDILVGNTFGDLLVLLGNGDGTFRPYRRADDVVTLAVADLTGNGRDDLIVADRSLDHVAVQYAAPGQSFEQDRQNGLLAPSAVQVADLNGDGIPDLIVANSGGNDVLVYPGLGNGQFGPAQKFATGTNPVGVTVAYLNDDPTPRLPAGGIGPIAPGLVDPTPDLIVANEGSNDVTILLGQGQGADWTLKPGPRLDAHGLGPVSTAVRYVPDPTGGPGLPDLLVANSQSSNVTQIPGVGGGFFNDTANAIQTFPTGVNPRQVLVGDFTTPGQLDLLTVNAGSNDLTFFPNFGAGQSIPTGADRPVAAVAADLNGDGRTDLLVADNGGAISLLLGSELGPTLDRLFTREDVQHPTDVALGKDLREFYVVQEGVDQVARFTLDFGLAVPSLLSGPADREAGQRVAEMRPLGNANLATVATLLTVAPNAPATDESAALPPVEFAMAFLLVSAAGPSEPTGAGVDRKPAVETVDEPAAGGGPIEVSPVEPGGGAVDRLLLGLDEAIRQNTAGTGEERPPAPAEPAREDVLDQVFRLPRPWLPGPAPTTGTWGNGPGAQFSDAAMGRSRLPSGTGLARRVGLPEEEVTPAEVLAAVFVFSGLCRSYSQAGDSKERPLSARDSYWFDVKDFVGGT